jgi:hypothetical protein
MNGGPLAGLPEKHQKEIIKFSKTHHRLIQEIQNKFTAMMVSEINEVLVDIYIEMGLKERMDKREENKESFEVLQDYSGVRVLDLNPKKQKKKTENETDGEK